MNYLHDLPEAARQRYEEILLGGPMGPRARNGETHATHGTPAGYKRHWRAKEPACDACLEAEAARERGYRSKRA